MRRPLHICGALLLVVALTLLFVAAFTSHWVTVTVRREGIASPPETSLAYHSRNRGIYRECWLNDTVSEVIKSNDYSDSGLCLKLDTRVLDIRSSVTYSTEYQTRADLLVAMWAMFGVAAILMIIALILSIFSACQSAHTYQWKYSCKASAGLMFSAAFLHVLGMALFHGAEYMEYNVVTDPDGNQAPYPRFFTRDLEEELRNSTTIAYSWSYALSWLAAALEILSAVLFSIVGCCYVKKSKPKKLVYKAPSSTIGTASRNPAYEYAETQVVVAPPEVYLVEDDYYQRGQRGYYDPYSAGQAQSAYSPKFSFERGWQVN